MENGLFWYVIKRSRGISLESAPECDREAMKNVDGFIRYCPEVIGMPTQEQIDEVKREVTT